MIRMLLQTLYLDNVCFQKEPVLLRFIGPLLTYKRYSDAHATEINELINWEEHYSVKRIIFHFLSFLERESIELDRMKI